jgi:NADH dehydrogenase
VERFVFFSALGASTHQRARCLRAKALAEQAVRESRLRSTVFAPSIVYAPGDPWLTLLERLALLPVMPVSGRGRAVYEPIWAEDVADCVIASLRAQNGEHRSMIGGPDADPALRAVCPGGHQRYELAGPQKLSYNDIVHTVLRSLNRNRPLLHVPTAILSRTLRLLEVLWGPRAFATWDEAELMEVPMISTRGTADAESLGVTPQPMPAVLGTR